LSPRWATTVVFFASGAAIGSWIAQIPWVQERFDLSKSAMGLVLLGMSIAVILVMPIAGRAVVKHGSERMVLVGGVAVALAVALPVLAPAAALVPVGLCVLGAAGATLDVSMNSHGVHVEHTLGRPVMSSLHAGWAFGGVTGSGFAAAFAALGVDPRVTAVLAAALLLATILAAAPRVGSGSAASGEATPGFTLPGRSVVLLALLCFLIMVTEGAMADWGGVYLRQDLGAQAAVAALAYAAFTAGMTAGRVVGDRVNDAIGPVALLRAGAVLTGLPLVAMLLAGAPAAALAGMFAVGVGVANGVPVLFSAVGRRPDTPTAVGIAAVSSVGSLGFLAGPPVIGFAAQATSLPWALGSLALGAAVVFGLARRATGGGRRAAVPAVAPARSAS
jgi:predicted MFS family arabinose efflux permease